MSKRLQIIDYFDRLVNELEIKAEYVLNFIHGITTAELRLELKKRVIDRLKSFVDEIERVQSFNLKNLPENDDDNKGLNPAEIYANYCFLLDKYDMNVRKYETDNCARPTTESNLRMMIDETFGYLIVTDAHVADSGLHMFKELLSYGNIIEQNFIHLPKTNNLGIDKIQSPTKSRIFEASDFTSLKERIAVTFGIFKKHENFIIHTSEHELFQVEEIYFHLLTLPETLQPDVGELFFGGPISIVIEHDLIINYRNPNDDIVKLINFSNWLDAHLKVQSLKLTSNQSIGGKFPYLSAVPNLHHLCLGHNEPSINPLNVGGLSVLRQLELRTNNPKSSRFIERRAFSSLSNLRELNLSFNFIEKIDSTAFNGLSNLTVLNLSGNRIKSLVSPFKDLTNLVELNLAGNCIVQLEWDLFSPLLRLKNLDLSGNPLELVGEFLLQSLSQLQRLNLSMDQIHPHSFTNLNNLKTCSLEWNNQNRPGFLPTYFFKDKNTLESLYLCKVDQFKFDHVNHLTRLDIRHSRLGEFNLTGCCNLTHLTLELNIIDKLEGQFLAGMSNLKEFNLRCNQIGEVNALAFDGTVGLVKFIAVDNEVASPRENTVRLNNLTNLKVFHLLGGNLTLERLDCLPTLDELKLNNLHIPLPDANLFGNLANLKSLDLELNKIRVLDEAVFAGLSRLKQLKLANNNINKIHPNCFVNLCSLVHLDVQRNQIESIDNVYLEGMLDLTSLILRSNKIVRVGSFSGLPRLETLDLGENLFNEAQFAHLTCLRELYLDANRIERLGEGMFSGLINLETLTLNGNKIKSLEQNSFNGLEHLRELSLANNRISAVHPTAFVHLKNLVKLDLKTNEIERLNKGILNESLGKLEQLSLGENRLTSIETDAFECLIRLRELNLDHNCLVFIEPNSFEKLQNLSELSVQSNSQLKKVDFSLFKNLNSLKLLHLDKRVIDDVDNNLNTLIDKKQLKIMTDFYVVEREIN